MSNQYFDAFSLVTQYRDKHIKISKSIIALVIICIFYRLAKNGEYSSKIQSAYHEYKLLAESLKQPFLDMPRELDITNCIVTQLSRNEYFLTTTFGAGLYS